MSRRTRRLNDQALTLKRKGAKLRKTAVGTLTALSSVLSELSPTS